MQQDLSIADFVAYRSNSRRFLRSLHATLSAKCSRLISSASPYQGTYDLEELLWLAAI
jgi:hypothetical protein